MSAVTLLHIAPMDRWRSSISTGRYTDPSLETEGFIHCSTPDQVLIPANERFAGRNDLVLLVIEPALLDDPIVFEDCYDTGLAFPHLYGPLPVHAVVRVIDFPPEPDGSFQLPTDLS